MDFNELLVTHTRWKVRLRNYIDNRADEQEKLDPDHISREDLCELGAWIIGEGRRHAGNPHFEQLRVDHAYFHQCAAEVVRRVNAGDPQGANAMLGPSGDFSEVSSAIVSAMNQLHREVIAGK